MDYFNIKITSKNTLIFCIIITLVSHLLLAILSKYIPPVYILSGISESPGTCTIG